METYEVIIIGGGLSGIMAARIVDEKGYRGYPHSGKE